MKPLTLAAAFDQALKALRKTNVDDPEALERLNVRWPLNELIADKWPHYKDKPFVTVLDSDDEDWCYLAVTFLGCGDFDNDVYQGFLFELEQIREGLDATKAGDDWVSPGRLVLTWPDLDPTARLVLFVMAAHGNNKGHNIFTSQQTIADYLGLTRRAVQMATRRLREANVITETAKSRQHRPPTYKINRGPRVV